MASIILQWWWGRWRVRTKTGKPTRQKNHVHYPCLPKISHFWWILNWQYCFCSLHSIYEITCTKVIKSSLLSSHFQGFLLQFGGFLFFSVLPNFPQTISILSIYPHQRSGKRRTVAFWAFCVTRKGQKQTKNNKKTKSLDNWMCDRDYQQL